MTTTIVGVHGRKFQIDGNNRHYPESAFITGPRGFAAELDREMLIEAMCEEFGLVRQERPMLLRSA